MELKGKVIDFLGDSITEGAGVSDIANNRYDNRLHKRFELAAHYNYGIGGTRIAHQGAPSENPRYDLCFCGRAYMLDRSADLIVVYGGVNDYIHGDAHFGTLEDKTPVTFCGGVYFLMNFLKSNYPHAKIVFMTPAHINFKGTSDREVSPRPMKKPDAKPLKAYVDVIKARGEELGVPVLDLFEKLPIDPNNEEDKAKYTVDGLHFNDDGQEILARVLGDFIEAL
jgi:lysophospholipase L1-like esterase